MADGGNHRPAAPVYPAIGSHDEDDLETRRPAIESFDRDRWTSLPQYGH